MSDGVPSITVLVVRNDPELQSPMSLAKPYRAVTIPYVQGFAADGATKQAAIDQLLKVIRGSFSKDDIVSVHTVPLSEIIMEEVLKG